MPRTLGTLWIAVLAAAAMMWPAGTVTSDDSAAPLVDSSAVSTGPLTGTEIRSIYLRLPRGAMNRPWQVLLALHGMGGSGDVFARDLTDAADQYGWLLVAPTIDYGDWTDPNVVAREDPLLIQTLSDYLDQLPAMLGMPTRKLALILGHSRGAQLAHRFAEFRPDKVLAVASLSAGDYTLPSATNQSFPFGVTDLATYTGRAFDPTKFAVIPFLVGVGSLDTTSADLPRQWDAIEGTTRVQRAEAFEAAMLQLGARSVLRVFGGARHDLTSEMRQVACDFLGDASSQGTSPGS
jgi:pimeloyl-ACP methyl ester carboxylesterase